MFDIVHHGYRTECSPVDKKNIIPYSFTVNMYGMADVYNCRGMYYSKCVLMRCFHDVFMARSSILNFVVMSRFCQDDVTTLSECCYVSIILL
jgi:hypothetical protein